MYSEGKKNKSTKKPTIRRSSETISIRVTPEEKERMYRISKACCLTLTETVKRLITGADLKAIPSEEFWKICDLLSMLRDDINCANIERATADRELEQLKEVMNDFKEACEKFYGEGVFGPSYEKSIKNFWADVHSWPQPDESDYDDFEED